MPLVSAAQRGSAICVHTSLPPEPLPHPSATPPCWVIAAPGWGPWATLWYVWEHRHTEWLVRGKVSQGYFFWNCSLKSHCVQYGLKAVSSHGNCSNNWLSGLFFSYRSEDLFLQILQPQSDGWRKEQNNHRVHSLGVLWVSKAHRCPLFNIPRDLPGDSILEPGTHRPHQDGPPFAHAYVLFPQ